MAQDDNNEKEYFMGDITGRPKAPQPQIVYVPQYVYQSPSTPSSPESSSGNAQGGGAGTSPATSSPPSQTPEQQREKTLLSRGRSRIGTILTGFRGIFTPRDQDTQRKTLLGE
jgi:hypothetical protein